MPICKEVYYIIYKNLILKFYFEAYEKILKDENSIVYEKVSDLTYV